MVLTSQTVSSVGNAIELSQVYRSFGDVVALDYVDLQVKRGEFFSLLGPSGCGKTTLLRIVAGLDMPDSGVLKIGGRDAANLSAHLRPVNTVFQSYALFPHLTVWDNVAFGLRMKKIPSSEIGPRVKNAMNISEIEELGNRMPSQLSGGQKQRVALARAIVNEPEVLLLDEPLGALDLKLRRQLQQELHSLQRRLGITFLYVTHDQEEALAVSDRIAVMNRGKIEQLGNSEELYEFPRTRYVAQFLGSCNLIAGKQPRIAAGTATVETAVGRLTVGLEQPSDIAKAKPEITLAVRPEKLLIHAAPVSGVSNLIRARIRDQVYSGPESTYTVDAEGHLFKVCLLNLHLRHQPFQIGQPVYLEIPTQSLVLLSD